MHVDAEAKAVGVWTVETWTGLREVWPILWPDWSLDLWDDRSAEQVTRAGGSLTLPDIDMERERLAYGERLDDLWLQGGHELVHLPEDEYRRLRLLAVGS
jgi:hypothetical protein